MLSRHKIAECEPLLTDEQVEVGMDRVFYYVGGPMDAPPVILVHGLIVSGRYFRRLAQKLALTYRVYALDIPGFGKSCKPHYTLDIQQSADLLANWMTALQLSQAVFVGQSVGCQIVAQLVLEHPELATHIVLISPTMEPRARWFPRLFFHWLITMVREPFTLYPLLICDYIDCGIPRSLHLLRYALRDQIEDKLPTIELPTLILRGSRDMIVPQPWVEELQRSLPEGKLITLPRNSHDVHFTAPGHTAEIIHQFCQPLEHPYRGA